MDRGEIDEVLVVEIESGYNADHFKDLEVRVSHFGFAVENRFGSILLL